MFYDKVRQAYLCRQTVRLDADTPDGCYSAVLLVFEINLLALPEQDEVERRRGLAGIMQPMTRILDASLMHQILSRSFIKKWM